MILKASPQWLRMLADMVEAGKLVVAKVDLENSIMMATMQPGWEPPRSTPERCGYCGRFVRDGDGPDAGHCDHCMEGI
jgi:hypothetical protein